MAIETPYSKLSALVIDDMAAQQSTLRGQLAMLGIARVDLASSADEAVRQLRKGRYSLVLCDYNLGGKTDGQQLFEYLRDQKLLAADTLFFMVTAENAYASVAAASEVRPDAYLLKPITASDVEERLKAALERRRVFEPMNACVAKNDLAGAVAVCDAMLARKDRWFMHALQHKGHLMLQLGRHEDAKAVFQAALAERSQLIWAQLGLARAHKAAGQLEAAKDVAQAILQSPDGERNVAAYDVLAEAMEASGDLRGAQWVLRDAATVVPSARRQRALAECAFRNGDLEVARECLDKVTRSTRNSITAQPQDTLMLAQTLVDLGQPAEGLKLLDQATAAAQGGGPGYESVASAIRAQGRMRQGDPTGALAALERARETLRAPKADFATVALAKAELATGHESRGLDLLATAVSADHENPRLQQLVRNALRHTGHEGKMDGLVQAAAGVMTKRIVDAKSLFRESRIDEALHAIETALKDYPENTAVLLQAAQMNCLSLRLKKQLSADVVERVRVYLGRLEKLLPGSDRVTQMQRYFRETLATLSEPVAA